MDKTDNRYIINETEREKILKDIEIGVWRIELMPDQPPRMYGDTNMYAILGAELKLSPEQLYEHWHTRIEPVYCSYVDKAVERLISTGWPVEVEYMWNHPQYGKTIVRCNATISSGQGDGKKVMLGLHRDITDKLVNNIWLHTGHYIVDYYKMSYCGKYLIKAYEDIFQVDIETKAIHLIAYKRDHCQVFQDGRSILEVIDHCVLPEDREKVRELFSDESIKEVIIKKSSVSADFGMGGHCGRHKWVRGTLHTVQINGVDELLFVLQDIQNEYKLKRLKEEKEDVLYSIIHKHSVIYEYDVGTRRMQILKHDTADINKPDAASYQSLQELADGLCVHYLDSSVWSEAKAFLSHENIRNCVEEEHKKSVSLLLDTTYFQYDYIKASVLLSSKSKGKVYLVLEQTNKEERLYPILESYIRDTVDHFYCIDLKKDYFFRFIGNKETYDMPPKEGHNYTQETLKYVERFVPEEDREFVKKQMSLEVILKALEDKQEFSFVESILGEDGGIQKKLVTYSPLDLSKGYVLMKRTDITDLHNTERALEKVRRESMTDPLTQLWNRLGSERLIKKALSTIDCSKNAVLIMVDLDNFKEVNDRFGHPVGDKILCEAAQKLRECFRSRDIIGRLGGDEYIIFLQEMTCKTDIHPVLERVVRELNIVCKNETESVMVTPSVGATFCKGQSYEELYREADIALYHSKKGKNRYSLYEEQS